MQQYSAYFLEFLRILEKNLINYIVKKLGIIYCTTHSRRLLLLTKLFSQNDKPTKVFSLKITP